MVMSPDMSIAMSPDMSIVMSPDMSIAMSPDMSIVMLSRHVDSNVLEFPFLYYVYFHINVCFHNFLAGDGMPYLFSLDVCCRCMSKCNLLTCC